MMINVYYLLIAVGWASIGSVRKRRISLHYEWNKQRKEKQQHMKKKVIAALGLCLLLPQLLAAPGCGFYWTPIVSFFNAGGEVIIDPEHYPYTVNANNVNATNQYVIRQGMEVLIYPPDCGTWTWGMGVSCPCNSYGSNTCQLPGAPLTMTGMKWGQYVFSTVCNCPNGSSYWGIALEVGKYCGPPPPP